MNAAVRRFRIDEEPEVAITRGGGVERTQRVGPSTFEVEAEVIASTWRDALRGVRAKIDDELAAMDDGS